MGLAMTRVKAHYQSWVGVVVVSNGGQRRKWDEVVGPEWGQHWGIGVEGG